MELVTEVKLTSNLKKNVNRARNVCLKEAAIAGEIKTGHRNSKILAIPIHKRIGRFPDQAG